MLKEDNLLYNNNIDKSSTQHDAITKQLFIERARDKLLLLTDIICIYVRIYNIFISIQENMIQRFIVIATSIGVFMYIQEDSVRRMQFFKAKFLSFQSFRHCRNGSSYQIPPWISSQDFFHRPWRRTQKCEAYRTHASARIDVH